MESLVAILASVVGVSLISFIGIVFVGFKEETLKRITMALVSFASGTLLAGALINLLPEALKELEEPTLVFYYVILGIMVFFGIEKFLHWRHCHEETCPVHTFAYLNLVGDGVHNFIDGMIIAATFMIRFDVGVATTLAVVFHEIPQEIGDFAVCIYGGFSKKKALIYNFISALTAILGAIITYFATYLQNINALLVPFAAGGFIYIATTDLMPELHKKSHAGESMIQLITLLGGIALMGYLTVAFGG
jgi:zinc and cadmium transporter